MPQYFSPGVYIQEVETGPVPIQGVSTSITGAVGVTLKGPTSGKPVLVTSFNDFQTTFGGFLTPPDQSQINQWLDPVNGGAWWQFPLSVKGYFDNGGQQLYVKRVVSSFAQPAAGSLGQGLVADLTASAAATDDSLQLSHLFGISKYSPPATAVTTPGPGNPPGTVNIVVNGNLIPSATSPTPFLVPWYDPSSLSIGLSPAPGQALKPGRDVVVIMPVVPPTMALSPSTGQSPVGLKFNWPQAKGNWGNSISVRVTPVLGTLSILPNTVSGGPTFSGSVATSTVVFTVTIPQLGPTPVPVPATVVINNQSYPVTMVTQGSVAVAATPGTPAVPANPSANPPTTAVPAVPPTPAAPAAPMVFTVTAQVSDGLQSLLSGAPVVIVPASGPNVSVNSLSIDIPTTFTVTIPQSGQTSLPVPATVIINNKTYPVTMVAPGSAAVAANPGTPAVPANPSAIPPTPAVPAVPPTSAAAAAPMVFTIQGNIFSDGLQTLSSGAPVVIVPASGPSATVNSLSIEVLPTANAPTPFNVTVTLNSALPTSTPAVTHVLIQGRIYQITANPTTSGASVFTIFPDQLSYAAWPANVAISSVRQARVTTVKITNDTIDINNASQLYTNALVELDNGSQKEHATVVAVSDVSVTLSKAPANNYWEGQKVRVLEASVNVIQYAPDGSVAAQESFSNLRLSYEPDTTYLVNYVNQFSKLVNVTVNPAGLWQDWTVNKSQIFSNPCMFPTAVNGGWLTLSGGVDALDQLSVDDFVGVDGGSGNRTGIQALEDIDDNSICVVPGMWANTIQSALVTFCEQLADRFAILDPPDGLDVGGIQDFRAPFNSEYAALYYPWLNVRDPSLKQYVDLAPSAHMAGIYAQTDLNRGVFKAPANVVVAGIYKFAADVNQREQDVLNPIGINALRFFPNRGYLVWGARTLSSDTTWQYINVRRIFIYVEKSILVGTQWVVFEPNDEGTWSRVRQSITNFLTTFWRQGGLQGTTAKEAFFVACDLGVTMTQDDIDNGRLICQIGIAPVKPAEFVIFQIQQYTQDATQSS